MSGFTVPSKVEMRAEVRREVGKSLVLRAEIQEISRRETIHLALIVCHFAFENAEQAGGIVIRQPRKHHRMNDAENGYRRSNPQRQRQNHGARESAILTQSTNRLSDFSEIHAEAWRKL